MSIYKHQEVQIQNNLANFANKLAADTRTQNYQLFVLAGKDDKKFTPPAVVLNNPKFTYEDSNHKVNSSNALKIAMQFMQGVITVPKLQLRSGSTRHFIFVSDDQAMRHSVDQGISEQDFRQYLTSSQANQNIHIHGIVCPDNKNGCVERGTAYYNLAADPKYQGLTQDLRASDWSPIFNALAVNIAATADHVFSLSNSVKGPIDVFANGNKLASNQYHFTNGKLTVYKTAVPPGTQIIVVY